MKALVTGGAGFIGSAVAKYLAHEGVEVVVADNLFTGSLGNLAGGGTTFVGVAAHLATAESDLGEPNVVIHCAGVYHPNVPASDFNTAFNFAVGSTANMCRMFPGALHMFIRSSRAILGERTPKEDTSIYTEIAHNVAQAYGVKTASVFAPYIYGDGEPVIRATTTVSSVVLAASAGRAVNIGNYGLYETQFADALTVACAAYRLGFGTTESDCAFVSGEVLSWKDVFDCLRGQRSVNYTKEQPLSTCTREEAQLQVARARERKALILEAGKQELRSFVSQRGGEGK